MLLVNVLDHLLKAVFTGNLLLLGVVIVLSGIASRIFLTKYNDVTLLKKYASKLSDMLTMNTEVMDHCLFNGSPSD
jgi:hypothetical protein